MLLAVTPVRMAQVSGRTRWYFQPSNTFRLLWVDVVANSSSPPSAHILENWWMNTSTELGVENDMLVGMTTLDARGVIQSRLFAAIPRPRFKNASPWHERVSPKRRGAIRR